MDDQPSVTHVMGTSVRRLAAKVSSMSRLGHTSSVTVKVGDNALLLSHHIDDGRVSSPDGLSSSPHRIRVAFCFNHYLSYSKNIGEKENRQYKVFIRQLIGCMDKGKIDQRVDIGLIIDELSMA